MKHWILLIIAVSHMYLVQAQEIRSIEYFIDDDPGFGQGSPLQVGTSSLLEYNIPVGDQGMHHLFVRAQDNRGHWSITMSRLFYVNPAPPINNEIAALEYFIDIDPGFGNATPIEVTKQKNVESEFVLDLSEQNVSDGYHQLFIRSLDSNGKWSITTRRLFYLNLGSNTLANIVSLEYFLETEGFISDTYIYPIEEPSTSVSLDFQADLSGLPQEDVVYTMSIYAVNENGTRSLVERRDVKVCGDEPAKASFTYQVNDGQVNLQNTSTDAINYEWLWGENNSATTPDHIITYEDPGLYEVCLVASNFCNSDTVCQYVAVPGIESVYPTVGTIQQKEATVTIVGYGLDSIPEINLVSAGNSTIFPKQIIRADSASIRAVFDFTNVSITDYTLQVINNNDQDTLTSPQFFSVLEKGNMPFDEWVPFELAPEETFNGEVLVPEAEKIFVFVKKADRIGYSGTWKGNVELNLGNEELATESKYEDFDLQLNDPISSVYSVGITNDRRSNITGEVKVSYAPDWLKLNEWQKGEILRPYGYDWKHFELGDNVDTLFLKTEGYGLWSTIEIFYQSLEEPENSWTFSNMGAGYAIQGNIINPPTGRYYVRYKDSAVLTNTKDDNQKREYLIYVGAKSSPDITRELSISDISTNEVGKDIATVSLEGTGFSKEDTVVLEREGFEDIYIFPDNVSSDGRLLSFQYDFIDVEVGSWNLKIVNDKRITYLNENLIIDDSDNTDLWVEIFSRDNIRIGRKQKLAIKYGNKGNTDVNDVLMYLRIPKEVVDTIHLPNSYYPDYYDSLIKRDYNYIFIPKLNAHSSYSFEVTLFTTELQKIDIKAGFINIVKDVEEVPNARYNKMAELPDRNIVCKGEPEDGDIVFTHFGVKKDLTFNTHAGIKISKTDPDGVEREYVVEINADGFVYARRWEFSEEEKQKYLRDNEAVNNGEKDLETVRQEFLQVGIDIDDSAYKDELKDWVVRNGDEAYIGYGRYKSEYDFFTKELIKGIAESLYQDHNKRTGKRRYLPYNPLPKRSPLLYLLNREYPEADLTGHCGSLAYEILRRAIGEEAENIFTPNNYPHNQVKKLRSLGLLCEKPNSTEDETAPTQITPYPEQDSIYDDLDASVDTLGVNEVNHPIESIGSTTPEDKYGPTGFDQSLEIAAQNRKRFVPDGQLFEYKIDYWNKEDATAPAAEVFIRDTLDMDFDISTFKFTEVGFLRWKMPLGGSQYFNVIVDMRPDKNLLVNIEGTLDLETREVYWVHRSLDPETMELPEDPTAGYLPPIDSAGYNLGWVNYTIEPEDSLGHNTVFTNQAHVNFDGVGPWGKAPPYGPYTNTIDLARPLSHVKSLAARVAPEFEVQWSGSDDGGGIGEYDIFVSENGGEFMSWISDISDTSAIYSGEPGNTYAFYSVATDHTSNKEIKADTIEASAYVVPLPGLVNIIAPIDYVNTESTFTWNTAFEADTYYIQISSDSLFSELAYENEISDTTFTTDILEVDKSYYWRVQATNVSGTSNWSETVSFRVSSVTGIEQISSTLPSNFYLGQNYPNPTSNLMNIEFHLPKFSNVVIEVLTSTGKTISTLINKSLPPGKYILQTTIEEISSGQYFYRIRAGSFMDSRKFLIQK